jgi:DNA-directed RNA polymerase specialized sigma24 family protein
MDPCEWMAEQLLAADPTRDKSKTPDSSTSKRVHKKRRVFLHEPIEVVLLRFGRPVTPKEIASVCNMHKAGIHKRLMQAEAEGRVRLVQPSIPGRPPKPSLWGPI